MTLATRTALKDAARLQILDAVALRLEHWDDRPGRCPDAVADPEAFRAALAREAARVYRLLGYEPPADVA